MPRPLLSFVSVVKNEASNFRKTLESVRPFISRWTVVDTGSEDGTQDLVREVLAGVPGNLFEEPFVDFAATRNRALELDETFVFSEHGGPAVFQLMLSGDETLRGGVELCRFLEERREDEGDGAYAVTMRSGPRLWPYPRVLRAGGGWRYQGRIHERPVGPDGEVRAPVVPGVTVVHDDSDPGRKSARLRDRDLPLLTQIVEDESTPVEERAHAIFFLAETHAGLAGDIHRASGGEVDRRGPFLTHQYAAMSLYWRYAEIAHRPEDPAYDPHKVGYALALYYNVAEVCGFYRSDELVARLEPLCAAFPDTPELHFMYAKHSALVDPRLGLPRAEHAAEVARLARESTAYTRPVDLRVEWMSWKVAADCAQMLRRLPVARSYAARGVEAGGPREAFAGLV